MDPDQRLPAPVAGCPVHDHVGTVHSWPAYNTAAWAASDTIKRVARDELADA